MNGGRGFRRKLPPVNLRNWKVALVFPVTWGVAQALILFFLLRVLEWSFFLSAVIAMIIAGCVAEFVRRWMERVSATR